MVSGLKSKRGLGNTTPIANKSKARSASRTKKMQSSKLLKKDKSRAALAPDQEPEVPDKSLIEKTPEIKAAVSGN